MGGSSGEVGGGLLWKDAFLVEMLIPPVPVCACGWIEIVKRCTLSMPCLPLEGSGSGWSRRVAVSSPPAFQRAGRGRCFFLCARIPFTTHTMRASQTLTPLLRLPPPSQAGAPKICRASAGPHYFARSSRAALLPASSARGLLSDSTPLGAHTARILHESFPPAFIPRVHRNVCARACPLPRFFAWPRHAYASSSSSLPLVHRAKA